MSCQIELQLSYTHQQVQHTLKTYTCVLVLYTVIVIQRCIFACYKWFWFTIKTLPIKICSVIISSCNLHLCAAVILFSCLFGPGTGVSVSS